MSNIAILFDLSYKMWNILTSTFRQMEPSDGLIGSSEIVRIVFTI